jgi:hypothetical protein
MRTYVKIEGENVGQIIQKLAKLAVDSPEICVWDYNMLNMGWILPYDEAKIESMAEYFEMDTGALKKECDSIVAKSGADLGGNNIYFEWLTSPSKDQLNKLRKIIDEVLKPYGNKYSITNKD